MPPKVAIGASLVIALALIPIVIARRRFSRHLDHLEAELRQPAAARDTRVDLPSEVFALAELLGATSEIQPDFVTFEQTGHMWWYPGGKPTSFSARQIMRADVPGFVWRAKTGLPKPVVIADYFVGGTGGLEVGLLGILPIAHIVGGAAANRGEVLRYLAELPLCPDAILANRSLDWTVVTARTIKVAAGVGPSRGEVTFVLGDDGMIQTASAPSRVYLSKDGPTERPWHGRFWDYQRVEGRLIPTRAEVAWILDTGDFVYWRGHNFQWCRTVRSPEKKGGVAELSGLVTTTADIAVGTA
jgi:hypothetical protein